MTRRWPLAALLLATAACGETKSKPTAVGVDGSGAAGGPDSSARAENLPDALADGAKITVERAVATESYADPERVLLGPVWQFRVEGQPGSRFNFPIPVHLPYDPALVPAGDRAVVSRWDGKRWEPMPDSDADPLEMQVQASVDHFSALAPTSSHGIRVAGRWYGTSRKVERCGEADAGGGGWGWTPWTRTHTFTWRFREEHHEWLGSRRVVVEAASWSVVETGCEWQGGTRAGYYNDRKWPGQEPFSLAKSYTESDLNLPLAADEAKKLADARARLEPLRPRLHGLEQSYRQAPRFSAERDRIAEEYRRLLSEVKSLEDEVALLEFTGHPAMVSAAVDYRADPASGEVEVTVKANPDGEDRKFTRVRWGDPAVEYDGRKARPAPGAARAPGQVEIREERAFTFYSPPISGPPGRPLVQERHEEREDETHEYGGLAPKTEEMPRVVVRGHVYHRLFVPVGDQRDNFVGSAVGKDWGTVAPRLIPVPRVRIDLFKQEGSAGDTSMQTVPMASTTSTDDGSFEVEASVRRGDVLRILSTYRLAEAQIDETCSIDVPMVVLAQNGLLGESPSIQVDWAAQRECKVRYRYFEHPVERDLDADSRPCVLRKRDRGTVAIEFNGMNSILVDTYCFRSRHVNQVTSSVEVTVKAREAEIRATCPMALKAEVEARLARDVKDGKTTNKFQGYEICYPCCTAMILDALWLQAVAPDDAPAGATQNVQLLDLCQGIYDSVAGMAFDDPFAGGDGYAAALETEKALDAKTGARTTEEEAALASAKAVLKHFRTKWPYVDADADDDNKQWILSLAGHRPWQYYSYTDAYLKQQFGAKISFDERERIDLFDTARQAPYVLSMLGRGAVAIVSIDHKAVSSEPGKPGGHILVLLGVIVNSHGKIVRLLFNDPFGDLTQHPNVDGYYGPDGRYDRSDPLKDFDPLGHKGNYVPYGNWPDAVPAWEGRIYGKWCVFCRRTDLESVTDIGERLLKPK